MTADRLTDTEAMASKLRRILHPRLGRCQTRGVRPIGTRNVTNQSWPRPLWGETTYDTDTNAIISPAPEENGVPAYDMVFDQV